MLVNSSHHTLTLLTAIPDVLYVFIVGDGSHTKGDDVISVALDEAELYFYKRSVMYECTVPLYMVKLRKRTHWKEWVRFNCDGKATQIVGRWR